MSGLSRTSVASVVGAALIVLVVVVAPGVFGGGGSSPGATDNSSPTGSARIAKRSLSSQTQVSATLGYADATTIVVPAGTAPSDLEQAQQIVATDEGMLQSARSTVASDTAALARLRGGHSKTQAAARVAADESQVSSARRGLVAARSVLAADESSASVYGQSSAYTALPAVGEIVRRGRSLYSISDQPVVLFYGPVAAWRAFRPGMSAGRDVGELNANLDALGYGHGLSGDSFTSATSAAIEAFQSAHGVTRTGQLLLGSVVFEPGAVRVTAVTPTIGATVQPGPVLSITSTARHVTIALDAAQQSELKVGDPVVITLPDNSTTPGRVSYVGTVATAPSSAQGGGGGGSGGGSGGSGTPTIEVDVTISHPAATGHLDQAPVVVSITTASVRNALVVPVNALLALANGGYALEEIGRGGAHHLVAVNPGLFDDQDGLVQVTGSGLAAGQRVVVPGE